MQRQEQSCKPHEDRRGFWTLENRCCGKRALSHIAQGTSKSRRGSQQVLAFERYHLTCVLGHQRSLPLHIRLCISSSAPLLPLCPYTSPVLEYSRLRYSTRSLLTYTPLSRTKLSEA